ncbi:amino acid adenylation domain-containing protein [bacterium]|nr:amino acid adenylation domain-containing protein [bacterium]
MTFAGRDIFPVSSGEKRLYALSKLEGGEAPYHLTATIRLAGDIDASRLQQHLATLIQRHDALRSGYEVVDDQIVRVQYDHVDFTCPLLERSSVSLDSQIRSITIPFNLAQPPLLHAAILRESSEEHLLVLDVHHIAVDGLSWNTLIQELEMLYNGQQLEPDPPQINEFTSSQLAWLETDDAKNHAHFWQETFASGIPRLELPCDHPRPKHQDFTGQEHHFSLPERLTTALRSSAREQGVTLNMLLLAAWSLLLYRLSGQDDHVIGFPTSGRFDERQQKIVGMLAGTSMVRLRLAADTLFSHFLTVVREELLAVYQHLEYPFEQIVEDVQVRRDLARNPLFDTTFVYEVADERWIDLNDLQSDFQPAPKGTSMFDIALEITDAKGDLSGAFEYSTSLFGSATIERWAGYYTRLLEQIVAQPDTPLSKFDLLDEVERKRLLVTFNQPGIAEPYPGTVVEGFLRIATEHPANIALRFGDEETSYEELATQSRRIAGWLAEIGVGRGDRVALLLPRSPDLIFTLLGVLRAGAAYLPLDPAQPDTRLQSILDSSGCSLMLVSAGTMDRLADAESLRRVDVALIMEGSSGKSLPEVHTTDSAYILATSGTTGIPKLCPIRHSNLMNYIGWATGSYFGDNMEGDFPFFTSISFDLTVTSLFCTLLRGRTLDILPDGLEASELLQRIFGPESRVDTVKLTPAHVGVLGELGLLETGIQRVILGGEAVTQDHVHLLQKLNPAMAVYNEYGPTETTVGCTIKRLALDENTITIGHPIANSRVYVLDENREPVPIGVYGELVVSGAGVFQGYLDNPVATEKALIHLPFDPAKRGYRTGDRARWRADGELECAGRLDGQIKLRGHRIEPGEIEQALLQHPNVQDAVVGLHEPGGEPELTTWLVLDQPVDALELRSHLAAMLPEMMIPTRFNRIDRVPLTTNGKRDLRALLEMEEARIENGQDYMPPSTSLEKTLAAVWQEVLKRDVVGIRDNYFLLGGDSIKAIQIVSRLGSKGIHLLFRDLFERPTIEALAPVVRGHAVVAAEQGPVTGEVPLSPIQQEFFARHPFHRAHFTQAVLLECGDRVDQHQLEQALVSLQDHHDALRMRYDFSGSGVRQLNAGLNYPLAFEFEDLRGKPDESAEAQRLLAALPAKVNLSEGPMLRALLLRMSDADRLLLAAHHLVTDGVSWRILVDDLNRLMQHAGEGESVSLPAKTSSFREYALEAKHLQTSDALEEEMEYWRALSEQPPASPTTWLEMGAGTIAERIDLAGTLDPETTSTLVQASRSTGQPLQQLLLTALSRAMQKEGTGLRLIALEGHGRDGWFDQLDLTRTVGWFTTIYPFLLPEGRAGVEETLEEIRSSFETLPRQGGGYGLLRWGGQDEINAHPSVLFNFLGDFDTEQEEGPFKLRIEPLANTIGPTYPRWYELEVECWIQKGCLELHLLGNGRCMDRAKLETLHRTLLEEVGQIADVLGTGSMLPEDGPLPADSAIIEKILEVPKDRLEEIVPLAPLQEGMLFHALQDRDSSAYVELFSLQLEGALDWETFTRAWSNLINRHTILRTRFVHSETSQPWQVVLKQEDVSLEWLDHMALSNEQQEKALGQLIEQEKQSGFDLEKGPLMRAVVVREGEWKHRLVWSFHHMLLDGWCMGIFFRELFELLDDPDRELHPAQPFSTFIRHLKQVDRKAATDFWKTSLDGIRQPTRFCPVVDGANPPDPASSDLVLDSETTSSLKEVAARAGVTLSTLVRTAWGALVSLDTGHSDVIFGAVSSGRPADLEGVDQMLGLFLTTLPVRVGLSSSEPITDLLRRVQETALEMDVHQYLPLPDIQMLTPAGGELFDHILAFENYPLNPESLGSRKEEHPLRMTDVQSFEQTHYPLTVEVYPDQNLTFRFLYDSNRLTTEWVEGIKGRLQELLLRMVDRRNGSIGEWIDDLKKPDDMEEEQAFIASTLEIDDDF